MKDNCRSNNMSYKRMLLIDENIASGHYPSEDDLMEMLESNSLGVSRATFYRLLKTLSDDFNAPIVRNKEMGGYEYTNKTYRIPALLTTEEQLNAARVMRNMLDIIEGTPLYDEAKVVFDRLSTIAPRDNELTSRSSAGNPLLSDFTKKRVIFLGAPCVNYSEKTWNIIMEAIKKNTLISFMYKTVYETDSIKRTLAPWQLIFDNGNWNVYGFDYHSKAARVYTLAQMSDISLRKEEFTLPEDFDFRHATSGAFGCYIGQESYPFSIKLTGYIARTASKRICGANQIIKELAHTEDPEQDSVILSFDSNQFYPILTWIQSWGADAVPLEPASLVQEWKKRAAELALVAENV